MDVGGGRPAHVTTMRLILDCAYSPDGLEVVYTGRTKTGGYYQIHTIGVDGSGDRALTAGTGDHYQADWQPVR